MANCLGSYGSQAMKYFGLLLKAPDKVQHEMRNLLTVALWKIAAGVLKKQGAPMSPFTDFETWYRKRMAV